MRKIHPNLLPIADATHQGAVHPDGVTVTADAAGKLVTLTSAAFAQFWGVGDLASMVGSVCDFHRVKGAKTAKTITFTVAITPAAGTITYDVLKNGVSIYTTAPTLACNNSTASAEATVNVALVDGDLLTTKIISAPTTCSDFRLDIYDS